MRRLRLAGADQLLVSGFVRVSLSQHARQLTLQLLQLLCQDVFLGLERVPVLETFVAAGLRVSAVLQRPSFLLQADHLVFADPTQMSVQLAHRQTHQLLVGETLFHTALSDLQEVVVMVVMMMPLHWMVWVVEAALWTEWLCIGTGRRVDVGQR